MQDSSSPLKRSYWCFISYKHTDNKVEGRQWASWLHQQLETYEVPEDLVGKTNQAGEEIPSRIFPVFRDEEELGAGSGLTDRIYHALDNTRVLVVLCSPRVVESPYVFEEIRYFKRIGKVDAIYAAVIDGEPGSRVIEAGKCFPDSLQFEVGADGTVHMDRSSEPLAADFRLPDGKQGWTTPEAYRQDLSVGTRGLSRKAVDRAVEAYQKRLELAKLKLISGILRVPLGVLQKRDKAYQLKLARAKARRLRRWLTAVVLLALFAVAGGVLTWIERGRTQRSFSNSLLDQGLDLVERHRPGEGLATTAGSLHVWSRNRVAFDSLFVRFSGGRQLVPIRRLPPPPPGTHAFRPQDLEQSSAYMFSDDRRYPLARFSSELDGIKFSLPTFDEGDFGEKTWTGTEAYTISFAPAATWQTRGTSATEPDDGYSLNGARIVSFMDSEVGGMLNSHVMGTNPDGSEFRLRFDVTGASNGQHTEMTALGLAAVSPDRKWLGVFGFLIDTKGDMSDSRKWQSLYDEPRLHLIDTATGKLEAVNWPSWYGDDYRTLTEGHDLHSVRFVNDHFVVHYSNYERPGWRTEIFDCSDINQIHHVVENQLMPGFIDDYNRRTGEFLVRAPDGLITFRLTEGPSLQSAVDGQSSVPAIVGVVADKSLAGDGFPLRVSSPDDRWSAEISRVGMVNVFQGAAGGDLVRSFSLQLNPGVEGGTRLDRALFLPDSPYLLFGLGLESDVSYFWSGWDFVRGKEIFSPSEVRIEGQFSYQLAGASVDGLQILFEEPVFEGEVRSKRVVTLPPATFEMVPTLAALSEMASGVQWTEQGLQGLNLDGYFIRRAGLLNAPEPESAELARWLAHWRSAAAGNRPD